MTSQVNQMYMHQLQLLNDAMAKHQELHEFQERLNVLETKLADTLRSNENWGDRVNELNEKLMARNKAAAMYDLIVSKVQEYPVLQPIWDELFSTMKLSCDDIEEEFNNIQQGWFSQ